MSAGSIILYRSKGGWVVLLVLSLLLAAAAGYARYAFHTWELPDEVERHAPTAALSLIAACVLGIVVAAFFLSDKSPKILVHDRGLVDYRSQGEPRFILWGAIERMECEISTVNNAVKKARITFHLAGREGGVEEVGVDIAGLSMAPSKVFQLLDSRWSEFNRRP